jgi:hypothetical protein
VQLAVDGDPNPFWTLVRPGATSRPTEKGAYLGIGVTTVPTVLRDQLKLQRGVGLVVNFVEKGSPAETAGVKQSDVLQKLDDQILINSQQFAVLVRNHPVDADVRLTLIREAKPMELIVKPIERDLPLLSEAWITDAANQAAQQYLKSFLDKNEALKRVKAFGLESKDDQHSFSIFDSDGHRTLNARDKAGKMIYQGPIDTPEQIDKLPVEIREKVRKISTQPIWVPSSQPVQWRMPMKLMSPVPPEPPVPAIPPLPPAPPAPPVAPLRTATDQPI